MKVLLIAAAAVFLLLLAVATYEAPVVAAGGLLYPSRRPITIDTPKECTDAQFEGAGGITLRGWRCAAPSTPRGTLVYLHGVADNRASAVGAMKRLVARGLNVVAYDSRAHGQSDGRICTYGYFEKDDLRRVMDTLGEERIVLLGHSLGAAVSLQTAARDPRVKGVVAVESFSDLRTVASERAFFLPAPIIDAAFRYAEEQGQFQVDAVSPADAARRINVPVLLIHGKDDDATVPRHSERIFEALAGPKKLILVDGARHNGSLTQQVWRDVDDWIDRALR